MRKNQSINVVVRFIGQALRMFNKSVLNINEELSDYNDMLNKLSDYNINIFVEYCKRDLNHA